MIQKILMAVAMSSTLVVSGCATLAKPIATSHEYVTPDGQHWAVQIAMHSGVPGAPVETITIVYNKWSKTPVTVISAHSKILSEELTAQVLNAVASFGVAGITGNFMLAAARAECPPGTLCGTLVQVQNTAGAQAAADSSATQTTAN